MAWQLCLDSSEDRTGSEFKPGTPFALKLEGSLTTTIKLQCKRWQEKPDPDDVPEWSAGEQLPSQEILPCYAIQDTLYRVVANGGGLKVYWNVAMTSQADRK